MGHIAHLRETIQNNKQGAIIIPSLGYKKTITISFHRIELSISLYKSVDTMIVCNNFGWNWSSGSGEDENVCKYIFLLFNYYFLLEKAGVAVHLNKLETLHPLLDNGHRKRTSY